MLPAFVSPLITLARELSQRGWSPATSGNYSLRIDATSCAITCSGQDKGQLTPDGIMQVDWQGRPLSVGKPSAETLLHTLLYQRDPTIGAILHTHSPSSTLLTRLLARQSTLTLHDYELLKALPGITTHTAQIIVPIFENTQDIVALAQTVNAYLERLDADPSLPRCYGYLIRTHGFYTWGHTLTDAKRHLEAFEFLFQTEAALCLHSYRP